MKFAINRYNLKKEFISMGVLIIDFEKQETHLTYSDSSIIESSKELYHPLIALDSLRKILEKKHESILGCNGCRIDTSYRPRGGNMTYIIHKGEPAKQLVNLFEPTNEITKLCTVDEHKVAYREWLDGFKK
jgi:hypothetical protein